jgi:hypothetical protein
MSRPETTNHIKDRHKTVATVYVDTMHTSPALLKAYVALIDAAQRQGGGAIPEYGQNVKVVVVKTGKELVEQLATEQRRWDHHQEMYNTATAGGEIPSWDLSDVNKWAEAEGLPEVAPLAPDNAA